jgi:hypothetical protein
MKYALFILLLLDIPIYGQNPGPRLMAMGSGGLAVSDIWSVHQNPAGITVFKRPMLSVAYEQHFLDTEVSTQSAVLVFPFPRNVVGLSFQRYGLNEYTEQLVGICYAKGFGDSFSLAIGLRYYQLSISQYGSAKAFCFDVGAKLKVTSVFSLASHVSNPNRSLYSDLPSAALPVKLSLGSSFQFTDKILVVADIRKHLDYPLDGIVGMEYNIIKWMSLRGGISVNPFKQYTGFGINYNDIQIDFSVASHPTLGYSPQISIGYEF